MCNNHSDTEESSSSDKGQDASYEDSISTVMDVNNIQISPQVANCRLYPNQMSFQPQSEAPQTGYTNAFITLSRSLGARDFRDSGTHMTFPDPPSIDEVFVDARSILDEESRHENVSSKGRIWINAAVSIDYEKVPISTKYTRYLNSSKTDYFTKVT